MAGFLACSPPFQLIIDNGQLSTNGSLPGVQIVNSQLNHQWQQDLPGFQNLQLRVQLRTFTGFPFTNRQRKQIRLHHNPIAKVEKTDE